MTTIEDTVLKLRGMADQILEPDSRGKKLFSVTADIIESGQLLANLLRKYQDDLPTPEIAEALEKWDKLTKQ